ncbi:hypothetical protein [Cellulomonas phragmiteti]|uniref:hypothetical protein n=1 Tax=Cellulomonas phragmiteti TaxID=478780 RepID=UPI0019456CD4|nr:hypothetical protein [Cellulomonas phragmiteti]
MSTFLRRALPTILVGGGLVLVSVGVLVDDGGSLVPHALLLVTTGGAAVLYRHLTCPPRPVRLPRVTSARVTPVVPTQRNAPHCVIPTQRPPLEAGTSLGAPVVEPDRRAHPPRARGVGHGGVRHCVVPRGQVPHQRRASDGS